MLKNNNLHSFDDIMDAQFGAPGTPEREQFNREFEAYCVRKDKNKRKAEACGEKEQTLDAFLEEL